MTTNTDVAYLLLRRYMTNTKTRVPFNFRSSSVSPRDDVQFLLSSSQFLAHNSKIFCLLNSAILQLGSWRWVYCFDLLVLLVIAGRRRVEWHGKKRFWPWHVILHLPKQLSTLCIFAWRVLSHYYLRYFIKSLDDLCLASHRTSLPVTEIDWSFTRYPAFWYNRRAPTWREYDRLQSFHGFKWWKSTHQVVYDQFQDAIQQVNSDYGFDDHKLE